MKQCPYCNAQMADESKFCGECGKEYPQGNTCPHCGANVSEGDAFCQNCGCRIEEGAASSNEISQLQKTCPHCGSPIYDGDVFCQNCGKNMSGGSVAPTANEQTYSANETTESYCEEEEESSFKKYIPYILGALALLLVCGGGWYGYKEYSAYTEKKLVREKFVADSLEQVRKDSIKLAEIKEKAKQDSIASELDKQKKLAFLKSFYSKLNVYGSDELIRENVTQRCWKHLIDENDYDEGGSHPATWLFSYPEGGDLGECIGTDIIADGADSFIATTKHKSAMEGDNSIYKYQVRVLVINKDDKYLIDDVSYINGGF